MLTRNQFKLTKTAAQLSIIAAAALFGANAHAAGAVALAGAWTSLDNSLDGGSTVITGSAIGNTNAYTDNPALNGSAWGHTGTWFTFENQLGGSDVSVSVNGSAGFVPGVTVWSTAGEFDGGTGSGEVQVNPSALAGTPHVFNATGAIGDLGTGWMSGANGNATATLGYAVSNPAINLDGSTTSWGEVVQAGAHAVEGALASGSTGANSATLVFDDLAAGWYAVYVGGADSASAGGGYDLVVSAVPEAETWAMLLAGLGLIGWRLRKQSTQSREVSGMIPA